MPAFTLLITSSPFTGDRHQLALRFAQQAAKQESLLRVFFYGDAVLAANRNQQAPQGQENIATLWSEFAAQTGVPLICCIANSLRRGLSDATERDRYQLRDDCLHPAFCLAGLGEMAEASLDSERIVQF
ncbi:MAG TPA: sulfurtransferase complex subunit TusD [Oceanospirillales bacterium]|nr:sulfurtransferase complex subunit TusD [Oceanospirillaceae bacterium]HBS42984.1 sulfurtransferase complex subunit TusD [Oceanospirillales bacterium]|tara:strand:- start:28911 stop:29297 length:387 start_codon:yes stop_codon:yes gene_type:complete